MSCGDNFPAFPDGLPVQDLLVVNYPLLKAGDLNQKNALWRAATTWGFWYLKDYGDEAVVESMFEMGRQTLALPFEEKMKYWQGNEGGSFGYKVSGATYADVDGSTDFAEFINVSKDDALEYPTIAHRKYPSTVNTRMETVIRPFVQSCVDISVAMMTVFNDKLGLPSGTLADLHRPDKRSISESRCIKVSPNRKDTKIALGPHTDFGSISILVNRLGGLQVLVPNDSSGTWKYVKPIPGYAICNIGDTLSILTSGILKSSLHRVVPPPGEQRLLNRWSLVYFARPTDDVCINALSDKSLMISEASMSDDTNRPKLNMTAKEWFKSRQKQYRTDGDKDVESYLAAGDVYNA